MRTKTDIPGGSHSGDSFYSAGRAGRRDGHLHEHRARCHVRHRFFREHGLEPAGRYVHRLLWAGRVLCGPLRDWQRGLPAPLHRQAVHVQPPRRQRRREDRLLRQEEPQHPHRLHGIPGPRGHGQRPYGRKRDGQVADRHGLSQDVLQRQHGLRHGRLLLHDLELRVWRDPGHGVGRRGHTAQLGPEGNEDLSRHPQGRRHGEGLPAEVRDPALRRRRHVLLRRHWAAKPRSTCTSAGAWPSNAPKPLPTRATGSSSSASARTCPCT